MMTNPQLTQRAKLEKLARELGVQVTVDPEETLNVLQTARRLLADGGELFKKGWQETRGKRTYYSVDGALREALNVAHPKNRDRADIAGRHAIIGAIHSKPEWFERGRFAATSNAVVVPKWSNHKDTTFEDALELYDIAIKNQGKITIAISKSKGRK
jgi:hypothetical protein